MTEQRSNVVDSLTFDIERSPASLDGSNSPRGASPMALSRFKEAAAEVGDLDLKEVNQMKGQRQNYHEVSRAYLKEKLLSEDENRWRAEMLHSLRASERVSELVQQAAVITCGVAVGAAIIWLEFILVPLTLSYFITYLLAPLLDIFEARPIECCSKTLCSSNPSRFGGVRGCLSNCFARGQLPHGLSLLVTLAVASCFVTAMCLLIYTSLKDFLRGGAAIKAKFYEMEHDGFTSLRGMGLNVDQNATFLPAESEPVTVEDLKGMMSALAGIMNEVILVLLLSIYLLLDRLPGATVRGDTAATVEIESMIKHYITLKTYISAMTGVVCGGILWGLGVKLASLWGLLSFVLNYIPNVGSIIAILLPLPIAFLDDNLTTGNKVMAFLLPGLVQGYVGNFLEPQIFGKSLNMTPMSVLLSLVFWGLVWGLPGAILSVPFLGIKKILLSHSDHVFAVGLLACIRQFPEVDEQQERDNALSNLSKAANPVSTITSLVVGTEVETTADRESEGLVDRPANPIANAAIAFSSRDGGTSSRTPSPVGASKGKRLQATQNNSYDDSYDGEPTTDT